MRKVIMAICCLSMAATGFMITNYDDSLSVPLKQNTLHAATIPSQNYNGPMPLDLQLDQAKRFKRDTVEIHDTVEVTNIKYVRVPVPERTTDTIYIPMTDLPEIEVVAVKNKSPGDREEYTLDETQSPKRSVVLIVDGNTVYSSKNENHSGGENSATSVSDEP